MAAVALTDTLEGPDADDPSDSPREEVSAAVAA